MSLHAGRGIGPYRLVEKIGEGGMGVVWKARDTSLDRDVALKFLPESLARDPERLARFEREAKAVAALAHPGILAIHGFGEDDGTVYAVTELLDGRTLREALHEGPMPPERVAAIALAVADGLSAAHDRGIVHRDLKPENLFLTRDGRTKILDFGLAAFVGTAVSDDATHTPTRTSLTTPGVVMGTTDYLSPEQVRGGVVDARSDLFALGTVIWEMLSGSRPFHRETGAETMTAILREPPPALPKGVPPSLERAARRCLEKAPEKRFRSARELAAALDAPPTRPPVGTIAAVLATVVVVAGIAWLGGRPRSGPEPKARTPASLTSIGEVRSESVEANEDFEKAMLFLRSQLDLPRAQQMLARAVELDPEFASARAMLGVTRLIAIHEGFSNDGTQIYACEGAAREIVASRPELASGRAALGAALLYLNRKESARAELKRALELAPASQPGLVWFTIDARYSGREAEAESRSRAMLDAVPLFWVARLLLAEGFFEAGHVAEARREIEKVFEQDSGNLAATRAMARLELHEGEIAPARRRLEAIGASKHPNHRVRLLWALLLAREGRGAEAVRTLDAESLKWAELAMFGAWQVAEVHALAGNVDEALDWLDRGVRNGDERALWLRRNAFLAGVRGERRFELILEAIERSRP
ncbi:MAG TPA: protein kinase [Candidatus Polarisedimenticolaceae bacterium]